MKLKNRLRIALWTLLAFVAMTDAARADPGSVSAFFAAVAAAFKAAPILYSVVSFGAQSLLAAFLAPKAPKQKGIKQQIETGGDNPLSFIMGEFATAGKMVYVNCTDNGNGLNNKMTLVISLSEIPVSDISSYAWVNGELNNIDFSVASQATAPDDDPDFDTDAPGPGFYRITEYDKRDDDDYEHQYAWVKFHKGDQTAADPYLTETFGADPDKPWTEDMIGRGCAYAIVVVRYSKEGVWSGVPTFKFEVKGIPLYDISKDTTAGGSGSQRWRDQSTWGYSDCPKVMAYNVARGIYYNGDWIWGGQTSDEDSRPFASSPPSLDDPEAYQFPASYWLAAIAHCKETITKADETEIKRYAAGCEISIDQQPIDIIKELDKCCAGYTTEYGGVWKTWCGPPGTSVLSITDDDIIITEDQSDDLFKADIFNGIRATYTKPAEGWVAKECPPRYFDDLVEEDDDYYQIADLQLPFVTEGNQAQRLMRLMVLESRKQITHNLQLPPSAFFLEENDVITWTSARRGYVNKKFTIRTIEDLPNCNQQVLLRECDPDDYDWDVEFELPETVGVIKPVKPGALALDFDVSPAQVRSKNDNKDRPAILVEWEWGLPDIDVDYIKWEVRRQSTEEVIAHGIFHNVRDNSRKITSTAFRFNQNYGVRLFAQPERKWRGSSWTSWKAVNINIAPTAPTVLEVDAGNKEVKLRIDKCQDADYKETIVYQAVGSSDFADAEEVARFHGTVVTIKRDVNGDRLENGASYYHWVQNEDTSEAVSTRFPAGAGVLGKPVKLSDDDVDDHSRSKTKRSAKAYSGTTTVDDEDFLTIDIYNRAGSAVKIDWGWFLYARCKVNDYHINSTTFLKARLWKQHGAGDKKTLDTITVKARHPASLVKGFVSDASKKNSRVYHDVHPKKEATTTYGVDVLYRGTGGGQHNAAVRRCNLNISWSTR